MADVLSFENGRLTIERPASFDDVAAGSSISVSGVCLSVVHFDNRTLSFDVIAETLGRTTLGSLKKGGRVNLERAMKAGDRFEGHTVQGHVDGIGDLQAHEKNILTITYPRSLLHLIVEKGSIAVDGVALTVTAVDPDTFSVALIPLTLEQTTLGELTKGDRVNLEADILGKYLRASASGQRTTDNGQR